MPPTIDLTALADRPGRVLVLAPHPDDFDAIAVTLQRLQARGHVIDVLVLTSGSSGVEDGFGGAFDRGAKAALREAEQRESAARFGLPPERLQFLRLWEDFDGVPHDAAAQHALLRNLLRTMAPALVFLPHGNDSNATHRRTFETFHAIATEERLHTTALLCLDAKTTAMRRDVHVFFDESAAQWKAALLRCHTSQQSRNLRTRGQGFDDRVLAVNRAAALAAHRQRIADASCRLQKAGQSPLIGAAAPSGQAAAPADADAADATLPYAEVFEILRFDNAATTS